MHVDDLIIAPDCQRRFGKASARAIARALHADGDCQTCVTPLSSSGPIALSVDRIDRDRAAASLHHESCQSSRWNDSTVLTVGHPSTTYSYSYWLAETGHGLLPIMALNPSLEQVVIRAFGASWMPVVQSQYTRDGMRANGGPGAFIPDARTITACVDARGVLAVSTPIGVDYPCDPSASAAPEQVIDAVRRLGALALAVTHAADPQDLCELDAINAALADPLTVVGRVRLRT